MSWMLNTIKAMLDLFNITANILHKNYIISVTSNDTPQESMSYQLFIILINVMRICSHATVAQIIIQSTSLLKNYTIIIDHCHN